MVWVLYKNALPHWFGFEALTLYPFVLVAFSEDETPEDTLKHEMTHVQQVRRSGFLVFYVMYVLRYVYYCMLERDFEKAYHRMPEEIEAYDSESMPLTAEERKELGLSTKTTRSHIKDETSNRTRKKKNAISKTATSKKSKSRKRKRKLDE